MEGITGDTKGEAVVHHDVDDEDRRQAIKRRVQLKSDQTERQESSKH